ncbi:MAG: PEP-CTERM sorting domain-containing protein [Desulfobacteraceae bacterium]|nr:PEP-CTERM sorting domain-containing protein [Desulfobacteraceae bacterium]MBC2749205.1 PEP-CTERM sorting domain-containing protein [Desulfobacteraceae bacterium]
MIYRVLLCIILISSIVYANTGECALLTYQLEGSISDVIWSMPEDVEVSDAAKQSVGDDVSVGMSFHGQFTIDSEYLKPSIFLPSMYFADIGYDLLLESGCNLQIGNKSDLHRSGYDRFTGAGHTQHHFFLGGLSIDNDTLGGFNYTLTEASVALGFLIDHFMFDSGNMWYTGLIAGTTLEPFSGYLIIGAEITNFYQDDAIPTPEPATIILCCLGLIGVYGAKRKKGL